MYSSLYFAIFGGGGFLWWFFGGPRLVFDPRLWFRFLPSVSLGIERAPLVSKTGANRTAEHSHSARRTTARGQKCGFRDSRAWRAIQSDAPCSHECTTSRTPPARSCA